MKVELITQARPVFSTKKSKAELINIP